MKRYGMVVDLNRCVGCQTCTTACKHANDTPPGVQWRRVLDVEQGSFPNVERLFLVTGCQHCAEPPCVPVCPTGATRQRADGLVTMNYDTCIGCASCAVACPYQARTIVHEMAGYYGGERTVQEKRVAHEDRIGVANKCTFCIERIDEAGASGLVPGVDPEVTPACSVACIAKAIRFGDFADPASEVSQLVKDNRSFQMHAELGTNPQIRYLYEIPAGTPGRKADPDDIDDEAMSDPSNPLVGARQPFWDYRAAMNFIIGGMSSGLAIVAWLASLAGMFDAQTLRSVLVVAAILMAVGLFFVFLKLGRKLRFIRVISRPQSSWMTRETWFVAVFYPAVAANFVWPHPVLGALAAFAALGFLICQGRMVYASKGIPAWRMPIVPWMLIATGVFEGIGLLAIALALSGGHESALFALAPAGLVFAAVNAALWRHYRATAKAKGVGPLSRRDLAAISPVLHVFGHLAPALLFLLSLVIGPAASILAGLAGVATLAGGVWWKFNLITRACHQQGFAVPMMPQRGSGTRAAPQRLALG
ncbi:MAG: dimethyl sulfoxide reductase anchor subunit [Betaproteobacteria bacterium]|nr:dimethyl sulfoxide reductase anchor subunit [Betaproteobacteria bacterium]